MNRRQIDAIEFAQAMEEHLNDWEKEFIESIAELDDDYELTTLQNKKLFEIQDKLEKDWIR